MPDVCGARIAEIGAGPGRVVNILLAMGAAHVTALEPSSGFELLIENTASWRDRVAYINTTGECLPLGDYDLVFSVGVLMCIVDPAKVAARALSSLRPGGRFLVWLYAYEGNEFYLALATPLRWFTTRMPDRLLEVLSHMLNAVITPYIWACRFLRLPRYRHFREVASRMDWNQRTLVIFDQLNPSDATYYSRAEAEKLFRDAGFTDIELYHRHGYSWAVSGRRPLDCDTSPDK